MNPPAALTFPVPGELGAILRDAGYDAEPVIRRRDGRDPMPSEEALTRVVFPAVETVDASGRGAALRSEVGARSVVTGPANEGMVRKRMGPPAGTPREAVTTVGRTQGGGRKSASQR